MNILGKILVFLVMVVTLFVLGFITHDFAARLNNQATNDQFKTELEIARKAGQAQQETIASIQKDLTAKNSENETLRQEKAMAQAEKAVFEVDRNKAVKDAEDRAKKAEINFESALAAQERMKKEVELLKTTVENREGVIIDLHAKLKTSQDLALALHRDLSFSQERNSVLVRRAQELEVQIAELIAAQSGKGNTTGALPKNPLASNPPQKFMKGVVERVDETDKSLVRISLGTDHGLKVGETLEVYRLGPNAEYIGMIRIEDAHHHTSVAKMIRTPGTPLRTIREGDTVSSTLSPR